MYHTHLSGDGLVCVTCFLYLLELEDRSVDFHRSVALKHVTNSSEGLLSNAHLTPKHNVRRKKDAKVGEMTATAKATLSSRPQQVRQKLVAAVRKTSFECRHCQTHLHARQAAHTHTNSNRTAGLLAGLPTQEAEPSSPPSSISLVVPDCAAYSFTAEQRTRGLARSCTPRSVPARARSPWPPSQSWACAGHRRCSIFPPWRTRRAPSLAERRRNTNESSVERVETEQHHPAPTQSVVPITAVRLSSTTSSEQDPSHPPDTYSAGLFFDGFTVSRSTLNAREQRQSTESV